MIYSIKLLAASFAMLLLIVIFIIFLPYLLLKALANTE